MISSNVKYTKNIEYFWLTILWKLIMNLRMKRQPVTERLEKLNIYKKHELN